MRKTLFLPLLALSLICMNPNVRADDPFPATGTFDQKVEYCRTRATAGADLGAGPSSDEFQEDVRKSRTGFLTEPWEANIGGKTYRVEANTKVSGNVAFQCQDIMGQKATLNGLGRFKAELTRLEGIESCAEHDPSLPDAKKKSIEKQKQDCKSKYKKMYAGKDGSKPLELSVHFGYMDGGPLGAFDPPLKTAMVNHLLAPCEAGMDYQSCGFKRENADDLNSPLVKSVTGPEGNLVKVRLKLVSTTESVKEQNSATATASQKAKSKEGEKSFIDSLQNDDAVFYVGHARSGNGPDFFPHAVDSAGKGSYDAQYYAVHDPADYGLSPGGTKVSPKVLMEKALEKSKGSGKPSFLMLASCDSEKHFSSGVQKAMGSDRSLVTFGNTTMFSTFMRTTVGAIHGILAQNCGNTFRNNMNADATDNTRNSKNQIKDAKHGAALLKGL